MPPKQLSPSSLDDDLPCLAPMLHFLQHHWYDLGVLSAIPAAYVLIKQRRRLTLPQYYLLANFLAVLAHQFEEYRFPGGFPAVMNIGLQGNHESPEQYPLNAHSAMITNVIATYGLYPPVIFYPKKVGFGMVPVVMGFMQFFFHGIVMNVRIGSVYNPGLLTVLLLHIPIGVRYIQSVQAAGTLKTRDVVIGVVGAFLFAYGLLVRSTFGWMADSDSPYPFTEDEMHRWGAPSKLWT